MTTTNEIIYKIPQLNMSGDYSVKGNILALSVEGMGKHSITLSKYEILFSK